ncbi:MAG: hydrogen gas-evolving membrane-bound hydrogenase subunit E [Lawsonibacter sp.]
MKHDHPHESRFERFMRWAEGEASSPEREVAEDPERAEFMEYLEYLDAHEHMDFGAYRLMRYREREAKGMPHQLTHSHDVSAVPRTQRKSLLFRHHRPGRLRRMVRIYGALSVAVACVLMATLISVTMELPEFGDPGAPAMNQVSQRYLEQGVEETGAVNAVAGMILDYRAFDTFGESTVLFAAAMSVILLLRRPNRKKRKEEPRNVILYRMGPIILPCVMLFGIYVVVNGHLSPGGGFSGGTVLGCGLILGALVLGENEMERLLPPNRLTQLTVGCLLAYGVMKGYSFVTGANHIGWDIPKGTPGAIFSAGLILPLNLCVGIIVACTIYTFYTLFAEKEE